ncbi:MAG: hypothetical protein K2I78_00465 [Clostridia bacterium]|nr:hypothetical protein [Clostridia bacterium]MDE7216051.1 hypothetical protein [Clostridia bacterium]
MKDKLKSYEFWASVISAILVVLQTLSIKLDVPQIAEFTTAFLGALSVAGILKKSKVKSGAVAETTDGGEVNVVLPSDGILGKDEEFDSEEKANENKFDGEIDK